MLYSALATMATISQVLLMIKSKGGSTVHSLPLIDAQMLGSLDAQNERLNQILRIFTHVKYPYIQLIQHLLSDGQQTV